MFGISTNRFANKEWQNRRSERYSSEPWATLFSQLNCMHWYHGALGMGMWKVSWYLGMHWYHGALGMGISMVSWYLSMHWHHGALMCHIGHHFWITCELMFAPAYDPKAASKTKIAQEI